MNLSSDNYLLKSNVKLYQQSLYFASERNYRKIKNPLFLKGK